MDKSEIIETYEQLIREQSDLHNRYKQIKNYIESTRDVQGELIEYLYDKHKLNIEGMIYHGHNLKDSLKKIIEDDYYILRRISTFENKDHLYQNIGFDEPARLANYLALAPFEFDLNKWFDIIISNHKNSSNVRYFLEQRRLWENKIDNPSNVLKKLINISDMRNFGLFYLASNFDEAMIFLSDKKINKYVKQIYQQQDYLPLFSRIPQEKWTSDMVNILTPFLHQKKILVNKIIPATMTNHRVGNCQEMENGFNKVLFHKKEYDYGNGMLLSIEDQIVAVMKMIGDWSILGLRNVVDQQGRIPIVRGGVYTSTYELFSTIYKLRNKNGKTEFPIINLSDLIVRPIEFLGKKYNDIKRFQKEIKFFLQNLPIS